MTQKNNNAIILLSFPKTDYIYYVPLLSITNNLINSNLPYIQKLRLEIITGIILVLSINFRKNYT